jgi:hypothetical protein
MGAARRCVPIGVVYVMGIASGGVGSLVCLVFTTPARCVDLVGGAVCVCCCMASRGVWPWPVADRCVVVGRCVGVGHCCGGAVLASRPDCRTVGGAHDCVDERGHCVGLVVVSTQPPCLSLFRPFRRKDDCSLSSIVVKCSGSRANGGRSAKGMARVSFPSQRWFGMFGRFTWVTGTGHHGGGADIG